MCEKELGTEQNCNILTLTPMAITVFLSHSLGLLNQGPRGSAFLGHVLIPTSSLQLQLLNWGPEGPLCWVLAFSTTSCLQLIWSPNWLNFLSTELYDSSMPPFFLWVSQIALIQPVHGQGYILIFLNQMHLLFTQVHFLFWQLGQVGGQYTLPAVPSMFWSSYLKGLSDRR